MARERRVKPVDGNSTSAAGWLEQHIARGPGALRERVRAYVAAARADLPVADTLAEAAARALATVVERPSDRSAALDLLAADALVTLALLAQAQAVPEELGPFAERLLRAALPAS